MVENQNKMKKENWNKKHNIQNENWELKQKIY